MKPKQEYDKGTIDALYGLARCSKPILDEYDRCEMCGKKLEADISYCPQCGILIRGRLD